MCLRKSQGCRCCKKVRGHLPEPEIQSVTVQIQLDGVHPKCTPHKSHSHTRTHHVGSQHTYTYRPCSTNPHHRWESLFNHTTWADQASVTPPTFYPPNTPPVTLLITNPGPRLQPSSTNRLRTVCGRHNNIQNKSQTERKWWITLLPSAS